MLTLGRSHSAGPIENLGRMQRRRWRRTADRIITDHRRQVAAALRGLAGTPVLGLRAEPPGTLRLDLPSRTLTVAGIAPAVVTSAERMEGIPCHVVAAGAYGRFWWLTLDADPPFAFRTAVLGSHIRLAPQPVPLDATPVF